MFPEPHLHYLQNGDDGIYPIGCLEGLKWVTTQYKAWPVYTGNANYTYFNHYLLSSLLVRLIDLLTWLALDYIYVYNLYKCSLHFCDSDDR